jgi:hypothetical protein
LRNAFPDLRAVQVLDSREERLKRLQSPYLVINQPARIKSPNWGIGKTPISVVKTKTLIDQKRRIRGVLIVHGVIENDLSPVTIAGPFVENKSAQE